MKAFQSSGLLAVMICTVMATVSVLLSVEPALGQDCNEPRAYADLSANAVRARMTASASHFDHIVDAPHYEVPAGSGMESIWRSNVTVGGLVDGRIGLIQDWQGDTQPGPLDAAGDPPEECSLYNHVYRVSLHDLDRFEETGVATPDILNWPWEAGAPVADGDGIEDNYNIQAGDRPAIEGHQMLWWVVNDKTPSNWPPHLGLEIQVSAFAAESDDPAVNNATIYRYRLTHHGEGPLTSAYFGMLVLPALGNFHDVFVGSDTTLGLAYAYSRDDFNEDDGPLKGYGSKPPALGYAILEGIRGADDGADNDKDGTVDEADERLPMSKFITWGGDGTVTGRPNSDEDFYNYLRGRWRDGVRVTYGGTGRGYSETPVDFMYPGNPPNYWSAENMFEGNKDYGGRNFMWSTGPFAIEVGETREIVVAILWAQGENRYDSIKRLKESVPKLRTYWDGGFRIPLAATEDDESAVPTTLALRQPYPNPAKDATRFDIRLPQSGRVTLNAYDLLGRQVATIADRTMQRGWRTVGWNVEGLSNGVYLVRVRSNQETATTKLVVLR